MIGLLLLSWAETDQRTWQETECEMALHDRRLSHFQRQVILVYTESNVAPAWAVETSGYIFSAERSLYHAWPSLWGVDRHTAKMVPSCRQRAAAYTLCFYKAMKISQLRGRFQKHWSSQETTIYWAHGALTICGSWRSISYPAKYYRLHWADDWAIYRRFWLLDCRAAHTSRWLYARCRAFILTKRRRSRIRRRLYVAHLIDERRYYYIVLWSD